MPSKVDLTGKIFENLIVLAEDPVRSSSNRVKWLCLCVCGEQVSIIGNNLRSGTSRSCGCLRSDLVSNKNLTHNLSSSDEYKIFHGMKKRCYNPKCERYPHYGGRGIKICDEWLNDFIVFYVYLLSTVGLRPTKKHSIDRIDVNGNYEPGNVRWATHKEQAGNRQSSKKSF